jgi:hypothetical protein
MEVSAIAPSDHNIPADDDLVTLPNFDHDAEW